MRLALLIALSLGACYRPFGPDEKGGGDAAGDADAASGPLAIDILWVIDNSTSMCQEQAVLSRAFQAFTDRLQQLRNADLRVAVTTVDAQCLVDGATVFSARGKFNQQTSTALPPACQQNLRVECLSDEDCAGLDCTAFESCGELQGEWTCRSTVETCVVNPNGSINTTCRRACDEDQECRDIFGDPNFICQRPSANTSDWGCLLPPPTADCPDDLPPFLTQENLDLFPCIATVGTTQEQCFGFVQPLRTGFMALDPDGINSAQAKSFLREDALLVVVIVSDGDDCSIADDASISEEDYPKCGVLATTDDGGPLNPVSHYVDEYKTLKTDPSQVIVVAIAGDSLATSVDAFTAERAAYREAKADPRACYQQAYICSSPLGTADFGARLLEFTNAFGPNGIFHNICGSLGFGQVLVDVADFLFQTGGR